MFSSQVNAVSAISLTLVAAVAVFAGLVTAVAPPLAVLLALGIVVLACIAGAYAYSKRLAGTDTQLAVYLVLLWVWLINVPAILSFDPRGIVRSDLFNPQSMARIALFVLMALGYLINTWASAHSAANRQSVMRFVKWPLLIFAWYGLISVALLRGTELLLALYRLAEWTLLLMLVAAVIKRVPSESPDKEHWLLRAAFPVLAALLLATVLAGAVSPGRVYFVSASGVGRIGNPFAHPNTLGIVAAMAFFYLIDRKTRFAVFGAVSSAAIMLGTFSRGAWVGFAVALAWYLVMRRRSLFTRLLAVSSLALVAIVGWSGQELYSDDAARILSRGSNERNLLSLSERTAVWTASEVLIKDAPLVGHGFIAGPKKLSDVMAAGKTGGYFRALHAHNDFVQAQLSGGAIAVLLLVGFLIRMMYLLRKVSQTASPEFARCCTSWAILLWTFGMLTPNLSWQVLVLGGLLVYLHVTLEWAHATRRVVKSQNDRAIRNAA
jgi:O-antigen ligase